MEKMRETTSNDWTDDSVWLRAIPSMAAKKTFFYVQEVGDFRTKPNYFVERKNLDSFLIVFTLSGNGYLTYENNTYIVSPNHFFFIDCMKDHSYKTDQDDLWEMVWVHFNGPMARAYFDLFKNHGKPVKEVEKQNNIGGIIHSLISIHRYFNGRTELLASKLLVDLLTEIVMDTSSNVLSDQYIPEPIKTLLTDIENRFDDKICLNELASLYNISKFHLVKQFKKYTGTTPYEYIISCRINHAKKLLQHTNLSVSEIANQSGIDNVSHFINLFRKREDLTPLSFRKQWQYPHING